MEHNIAALLMDDVKCVDVIFSSAPSAHELASSTTYTYLATAAHGIQATDLVIVPTPKGYGIVTVVSVRDADDVLQPGMDIKYKWLVGKVDLTAYIEHLNKVTALEEDVIRQARRQLKEKWKQQMLQQLSHKELDNG